MKRRRLFLACDAAYFELTRLALASFDRTNPGWNATIVDVGLEGSQRDQLARRATVLPYSTIQRYPSRRSYFPSGLARVQMLSDLTSPGETMLYLDSDLLVLGDVADVASEFESSGRPIGLAVEDGESPLNWSASANDAWAGAGAPPELLHFPVWKRNPVLNTGVLFCDGGSDVVKEIGRAGVELMQQYPDRIRWGEQTIIDSLIYEWSVPFHRLPHRCHYFGKEECLEHEGRPYLDAPPRFQSQAVLIRHFAGKKNKKILASKLPELVAHYPPA